MTRDPTWESDEAASRVRIGALGWLLVLLRGSIFVAVTFGGLAVLLFVRLIERPFFGIRRPWTPFITQFVCRTAFRVFGMQYQSHGVSMAHPGAVVSNHSSWMDIFVLNATDRVYFVAKSEVAAWPGIGWLARATGTVFIRRSARDAGAQKRVFEDRLGAGHRLLFFPEGTSTDGRQVLPFKPTLFAAFFAERLRDNLWVQPVTVRYQAPEGEEDRFYGWWGDMDFAPHLLKVLAARRQGGVELIWHRPLRIAEFADRKALAKEAGEAVSGAYTDDGTEA